MDTFKLKALMITLLCLITSCNTGTNKKNRVSTTTQDTNPVYVPPTNPTTPTTPTDPPVTGGHGDGTGPGISDAGQTINYYSLNNIIVHGTADPNRFPAPNNIPWSSATGIASSDQQIFTTNSRFNVRVRAQKGPAQNTNDVRNIPCSYVNDLYKKLEVTLCLRSSNGTCVQTHTFSDIPLGQVSKIKEFTVPGNTANPLVLEVLDVQWDYTCTYYGQGGFNNELGYCPFAPIWDTQCVKFDLQFSTDTTKDLDGPRY